MRCSLAWSRLGKFAWGLSVIYLPSQTEKPWMQWYKDLELQTSKQAPPVILKPKAIGNFTSPFGASSFDLHFCCCSCASCCCSQAPIQTLQIKTPFFSKSFLSFTALFVPFTSSERKTAIFQSPQLQCLWDQRKTLDFFSCPKDFETKKHGLWTRLQTQHFRPNSQIELSLSFSSSFGEQQYIKLEKDLEFAEDTDFSLTLSESNFATRKNQHVDHPSSPTNPRSLNQVPPQARIPNMIPPANQGENFSPKNKPNTPPPKKKEKGSQPRTYKLDFVSAPPRNSDFKPFTSPKPWKTKLNQFCKQSTKNK